MSRLIALAALAVVRHCEALASNAFKICVHSGIRPDECKLSGCLDWQLQFAVGSTSGDSNPCLASGYDAARTVSQEK